MFLQFWHLWILQRFFSLPVFPLLIKVSGWYYHFDVLFFHLFNSTGVVIVALANLRRSVFVKVITKTLRKTLFIVVPFISSTGLAIVAEADLSCVNFLPEKSCHKLVVSTSFWSWLLKFLQFWHLWNTQRYFFELLLRCGYAGGSWEFWILVLVFMLLKNFFFVFIFDAIFFGTTFSFFGLLMRCGNAEGSSEY